jgi:hypothetical protein
MAVGPKQLDHNFMKEVEAFEKHIDGALLKKSLSPKGSVIIDTPDGGFTNDHFNVLKVRYGISGWKNIRREFGDQRDSGDWLIFES